jgi:hypothetical protein
MGEIERNIVQTLELYPGLCDRELADIVKGRNASSQYINQNCRMLESQGILMRQMREDGRIGNYLKPDGSTNSSFLLTRDEKIADNISEKKMKQILEGYLTSLGWDVEIAWGPTHGIDIQAKHNLEKWIIEVKGSQPGNPLYISYFLSVLGEILQRMDDPACKYSIALPDIEQFHRLWERLPTLTKERTRITALFVNLNGSVIESN